MNEEKISNALFSFTRAQQIHSKHDLIVWFEILELASSGEYVPVLVDHSEDLACRGLFYLHHGLQRRIRLTIVHEAARVLRWSEVRALVVGRIRSEATFNYGYFIR